MKIFTNEFSGLKKNTLTINFVSNFPKSVFVALILAVLTIIFFGKTLFFRGDYIIHGCDFVQTYYPKLFYKDSLLRFKLPLWNPYLYSGYPFLAHPYNETFYPLNLLFLIMPINVGYGWILALHVFLAGIFMFLLVKYLVSDNWAALVSALAFMFSGYTVNRIWAGHFELYTTSVWIPLIFLFFLRTIEKKSVLFAFFTGSTLAIQFFAGHNQTLFFMLMILTVYTLFICFESLLDGFNRCQLSWQIYVKSGMFRNFIAPLFLYIMVLFLFVIFAAIQLFPTLEMTRLSTRASGIPFFMSAYGSFPPDHLIRFLIPNFYGNFLKTFYAGDPILGEIHWEFTYYIGIIPLGLAIYSIYVGLNEKTRRALFLVTLFALIISGLTRLIFLNLWKVRNDPVSGNHFVLPIVKFFEGVYTGEISVGKILPLFAVFFIGIVLVFQCVKRKCIDTVKSTSKNDKMILFFALLSLVGTVLAFGHYSGGLYYFLYKFLPAYNKFKWPSRHLIITNFSLCVLAGYGLMRLKLKKQNFIKLVLIIVVLADLFWYGNRYLYLDNQKDFLPSPKIINYLAKDKEIHRILIQPVFKPNCVFECLCLEFQMNASIPLHLYNITGYDPMIIQRYHEFTNILQGLPLNDFGNTQIKIKDLSNQNLLKFLNVKYMFLGSDLGVYNLNMKNVEVAENFHASKLLLYKDYLPRFMFVKMAKVANNDGELKSMLISKEFVPDKYVFLEAFQSPIFINEPVNSDAKVKIDVVDYSSDQIDLEVTVAGPGYLTTSEVYYPGWKAFIDGKEAKIYRANYAFRSIFIPFSGIHRIQFRFDPESLKTGKWVTFLGICFAALYCIMYSNKKIRGILRLK